jgi:hypothetical protein
MSKVAMEKVERGRGRRGVHTRLRRVVENASDDDTRLLVDLSADSVFDRFSRLGEAC